MQRKTALIFTILISTLALAGCFKKTETLDAKQSLGQKLYFDARLSSDGSISCNSCHNVFLNGTDGKQFSAGVHGSLGGRNSPTVFNAKFLSVQFWDGRAKDLSEQALGPMINLVEMGNNNHDEVVVRLKKIPGYVKEFDKVFGPNGLTIANAASAIAAYEETLTTLNSPYDKKTMSAEQKKGFETFKTVGCTTCHSGDHFAGPEMPVGTGFYQKFPLFEDTDYDKKYNFTEDPGRFTVTLKNEDKFMFRVPTLRNIAITAPYFHNGSVNDLSEAVRVMAKTQLNKDLSDQEVKEIVTFLEALTGTPPQHPAPTLPPTIGTSVAEQAK